MWMYLCMCVHACMYVSVWGHMYISVHMYVYVCLCLCVGVNVGRAQETRRRKGALQKAWRVEGDKTGHENKNAKGTLRTGAPKAKYVRKCHSEIC